MLQNSQKMEILSLLYKKYHDKEVSSQGAAAAVDECGSFASIPNEIFLSWHPMFRIWLNGMWSKDYVQPLAQVLCNNLGCELEAAQERIKDLGGGKRMYVLAESVGKAHELACDLLQYGCYIEIEQVGPLTDAAMIADLHGWFEADQSTFRVVMDMAGHVAKIIEVQGYGYLHLEAQAVRDWVGEELIRLGAQRVEATEWPALQNSLDQATADNEARRMQLRAERAAAKERWLRNNSGGTYQEEE
jgi:hypothetical protein